MSGSNTYRSSPAFAIGGIAPEFTCKVCGGEAATYPKHGVRGICEAHCFDHDYEYDRESRNYYCVHCSAAPIDDWYACDDDVGFSTFTGAGRDIGPLGIPASAMNGNAAQRHMNPGAWDNWVAFCNANGQP